MWKKTISVIGIIVITAAVPTKACSYGLTAGAVAYLNAQMEIAMQEEPQVVSEDDIELLAKLITAEQGYASNYDDEFEYEERAYLCGSVVINRMNSEKFPDTVGGVVNQPGQYQCVRNGHINRDYDDIAWEIAEELLAYGTTIDEEVVYQAEFPQGSGVYRQIGNTYFCYE